MFWVEHRDTLRRVSRVNLVPSIDIYTKTGFRSVYQYDDETAQYIIENNTTAGLSGTAVRSDMLFTDFDNQETAAVIFTKLLISMGIAFSAYHSGGRSIHHSILIEPEYSVDIPARQKQWIKENAPLADTSFYHTSGIYRLPNTPHYKYMGRRKTLLKSWTGDALKLPPLKVREHIPTDGTFTHTDNEQYSYLLFCSVPEGSRRPHLLKIIFSAMKLGLSPSQIINDVLIWNDKLLEPHSPRTIEHFVMSTLQYQSRRGNYEHSEL